MKKSNKNSIFNSFKFKIFLMAVLTIITSSTLTFGFFFAGKSQSGTSGMNTLNCFDMSFSDANSITLEKAMPVSDEAGKSSKPYTFTIKNNCPDASNYYVILNVKADSFEERFLNLTLDDSSIKRISSLRTNTQFDKPEGYDRSYIISKGTLEGTKELTHKVRIWMDKDTTYDDVKGKSWEGQIKVVSVVKKLDDQTILAKLGKTAKEGNPTFASPATTDETADGLYTMEDDYGTSYYYRGNVEDNYVKFAGYYWRIIRVNGDGSVRVIYDGTSAHANSDTSADRLAWSNQRFNAKYDDAKYVGYMYGPVNAVEGTTTASTDKAQAQTNTVSSDIKTKLEEWYVTNIKDKNLDEYVADSIFCYDRTTPGSEATGWSIDTGLGYGKNNTGYGALSREGYYVRKNGKAEPQYVCSNKNDAFTVGDTEKGNGSLSEKIGLISADEVVTGGSGKFNTVNQSYYLHKGNWYWAGSPSSYDGDCANVFSVTDNGHLYNRYVYSVGGVAPVINLRAEYFNTLIGDGTIGNEFREA